MQIAIIGGKLQGVEATYLAQEAKYKSTVIDINPNCAASMICDEFFCGDVFDEVFLRETLSNADIVLPAIENIDVLNKVYSVTQNMNIPFIYHPHSYDISSSKQKSDVLFKKIGIPCPTPYPHCSFPLILKPNCESGSQGVKQVYSKGELNKLIGKNPDNSYVIQQYIEGPSYSIEIIGDGKNFAPLQITQLFIDEVYDCCKVVAPVYLENKLVEEIESISLKIANTLKIKGIFDVEVILHENTCKVLEIDARLPSQTPTAVYHSTGINILEMLCDVYLNDKLPQFDISPKKAVIYEHIYADKGKIKNCGEHIMGNVGSLNIQKNFLGADVALTSVIKGNTFAATLIFIGDTYEEVKMRSEKISSLVKFM